ncbi:MAG: hypothetical protein FWG13_06175 [Leptospirales bacterium]|nr:hypothetical protein [Leptospirales bacterium]
MKIINNQPVAAVRGQSRALHADGASRHAPSGRNVGDAFAIAQMSRVVIQKAIQAAAVLKSVASQALASDSAGVNPVKLETAVNMIPREISVSGMDSLPRIDAGKARGFPNETFTALTEMIMDIEEGRAKPPDVSNLVKLITKNPSLSLNAQGNIDHGAAMRHLR